MNQGNKLNYVIFLVLSFAIIIGSSFLLNKSSDKTPKPDTAAENQGKQKSPLESTFTPGTENIAQKQHIEDIKIPKSPKGKLITVTTPLFVAKIDSFGGRIIEWDLLDYKETTKAGSPDVNLFSNTPSSFNPFIWIDNIKMPDFIPFQYDGRSNINITNYKKEIALRWTSPEGIEVKNIYEIDPGSYLIKAVHGDGLPLNGSPGGGCSPLRQASGDTPGAHLLVHQPPVHVSNRRGLGFVDLQVGPSGVALPHKAVAVRGVAADQGTLPCPVKLAPAGPLGDLGPLVLRRCALDMEEKLPLG